MRRSGVNGDCYTADVIVTYTIFRSLLPGRADVSLSYYIHSVNTQYAVPSVQVSSNLETSYHDQSCIISAELNCFGILVWQFDMLTHASAKNVMQ